ncbi:MAG: type IV secretory system conjugative DNA transfer family protein [Deltaproteobacteria bacterium]|nr:type IV secretory system conjugative DNA transfer family protein [Deltaproteobacteria bacterium]
MAEYRPYRITNSGAQAQLTRVKLIAVSSFLLLAVLINWIVTQHVARRFGYASGLGPSLIGNIYAPWEWLVWWTRWHWAEQLQPLWELCIRQAAYPLIILAIGTVGVIGLARYFLSETSSDLHGSARWATTADVRSAGLIAPRTYLPQSLRGLAVRLKVIKPLARRVGIYLGVWQGSYLRDCGPGHVLVMAPTRSGKGVGVVVPTLLTWPHSTLVHDLKGENWQLTAGARQRMGHICLKFDPTDTTGTSVKFNPLEQVRLRTVNEAEDVQNIVHMIIDPDGKGLNDHWVKTGAALLTGTILHVLYAEPNKTLRGVAGFLSDPVCTLMETIERMLKSEHDPAGAMDWRDHRGIATLTHPLVAESMREILSKSDNERAGVFSTVMSFLSLYRDPIVAANTQYSEFKISDLVNHERPVSLYLVVPMASRDRLRPLIRLILNQIIRTLTTTLAYKDGRAISANRHPLLLMLDEFPMLGRLEVLAEALSLIAGYGIRACLVAQDLTQIYAAYGHDEAVTINCDTTVAFAPNKIETARMLSELTGETTVRHAHRMVSSIATSVSEPETARSLITPDEVRRLSGDEVLIFTRGHPAIRTRRLKYHQQDFFQRRASIAAPKQSDRIIAEPAEQEKELTNGQPAEQTGEEPTFLSYGVNRKELV